MSPRTETNALLNQVRIMYPQTKAMIDTTKPIEIDGVRFAFWQREDREELILDNVFIEEENRGKGLLAPALDKLLIEIDKEGIALWTTVMPDIDDGDHPEEEVAAIYEHLRSTFNSRGFGSHEDFRNDMIRPANQAKATNQTKSR